MANVIDIPQHLPYIRGLKPTLRFETGNVIYFHYDCDYYPDERDNHVFRYSLVIAPNYKGLVHTIRMESMSRYDIQKFIELVWNEWPPNELYHGYLVSIVRHHDGYRTYKPEEMSRIQLVNYRFFAIGRPVFEPSVLYYDPSWGRDGGMMIASNYFGMTLDQVVGRKRKIAGYPTYAFIDLAKRLSERGIHHENIFSTGISKVINDQFQSYGINTKKYKSWKFSPIMLKRLQELPNKMPRKYEKLGLTPEQLQKRVAFEGMLAVAKRVGGIFLVSPDTLSKQNAQTVFKGLFNA